MSKEQIVNTELLKVLQGMDYSKLEETALRLHTGEVIHMSTPTCRSTKEIEALDDLYSSVQRNLAVSRIWGDDIIYSPPEPHLQSKVNHIIDKFWANPGFGATHLYLEQLERNPVTKNLFKGKSTTHHYPWYKQGSKY